MTAISAHSFAIPARARRAFGLLAAAFAAGSLALGCAPSEGGSGERALPGALPPTLARAELWRPVPHFEGPSEGGEAKVTCGERDLRVEGGWVEVSTATCNYAMLRQPALAGLDAGDELAFRLSWDAPDGPEPATVEFRLFLGLNEVWQERVALPGRAGSREVRAVTPLDLPKDVPLSFVVSASGANSWRLGELSASEAE